MESNLIKTIFFASVVWLAGALLTQDALGADTVVYAIRAGGAVGTLDLNTGVFSQVTSTPAPFSGLGEYGGVLYGANGGCDCLFQFNPATAATTIAPHTFNQVVNGVNNGFGALNGLGSTTAGLFIIGVPAGGNNYFTPSIRPPATRRASESQASSRVAALEPSRHPRFDQAVLGSSNQLHGYALQHQYLHRRSHHYWLSSTRVLPSPDRQSVFDGLYRGHSVGEFLQ